MKKLVLIAALFVCGIAVNAQNANPAKPKQETNTNVNPASQPSKDINASSVSATKSDKKECGDEKKGCGDMKKGHSCCSSKAKTEK